MKILKTPVIIHLSFICLISLSIHTFIYFYSLSFHIFSMHLPVMLPRSFSYSFTDLLSWHFDDLVHHRFPLLLL